MLPSSTNTSSYSSPIDASSADSLPCAATTTSASLWHGTTTLSTGTGLTYVLPCSIVTV